MTQQIPGCQADVVIMDVAMPGGGTQATAQLRQACPNVQAVALTRHSEAGYVRQLLQAGARPWLVERGPVPDLYYWDA